MKLEGKIKHGIALAIDHNDSVDCDVVYYGGMTIRLVNASYDDLSIAFGPVGSYVDMSAYYTKEEIDNKGYLTEHQDISGKADKATTYTKSEVDTALGGKQETLVSGNNVKTINNESLLGSGNINIQGGGGVQSDWNVSDTSSMAYIKNKPTIPTVPTNVSAFTNDAGYLTTETDPTVPSHVKGITQQNITNWNGKADVFTINCVYNGTSITSCDKTFAEISSAYNSGKILNVVINNGFAFGRLNQVASDAFYFNLIDTLNDHWIESYELCISSNNTYNITLASINIANYYTKSEINTMIGDIETLLANI